MAISLFGPGANGKESALLAAHDSLEPQVSTSVKVETLNPSWSQRFALDLTDALARQHEHVADLVERVMTSAADAKA